MEAINIPDRIEDLEVKYLFVKKWKWINVEAREKYQGHPEEGRVYRAFHHTKTKSYRVMVPGFNGFLMDKPIVTDEDEGFLCECEVVEKKNLCNLNFKEEDLDNIINWIETKNSDLYQQNLPIPLESFLANIGLQHQMEQADRMAYVTDALTRLDSVNSIQVDVLLELIETLYDKNLESVNQEDISLDENHGLGVNVSRTQDALKRYAGNDRRTNEAPEDLYEAMGHLVKEAERRIYNELD